ncbi:MAG: hypothetical protein QM719_00290 [Thermomonas sp.]
MTTILLSLPLMAHAVDVEEQKSMLEKKSTCCESFRQFHYEKLPETKLKFRIDEKSPVFQFEADKSYFAAFEVPDNGARAYLLQSYFGSGWKSLKYFAPIVTFLDKDFNQTRKEFIEGWFEDYTMMEGAHMAYSIRLNEGEKYIIISTGSFDPAVASVNRGSQSHTFMVGSAVVTAASPAKEVPLDRRLTGKFSIEPTP